LQTVDFIKFFKQWHNFLACYMKSQADYSEGDNISRKVSVVTE